MFHGVTKGDEAKLRTKQKDMSRMIFILLLGVSSAQFNSNPAVAELNGAATLSWQIPAGGLGSGSIFHAISPMSNTAAFLLFSNGLLRPTDDYKDRVEFTGSYTSRNITFTLRNISSADAGTYRCGNGDADDVISDCGQMLVVLGKPTKPARPSPNTLPVYTKQVTLNCTSTSTSIPAGHGLTLTYTWESDGAIVTPYPGMSFSFNVTSRDPHNYRCRADESRGLDSDWSDVFQMTPEYGPYQETLTPPGLSYTVRENQNSVPPISCSANCKPDCTYRWENNGKIISNSAVMNLGQSSRSQTGSYRCRAINEHNSVFTSSVSVNVNYLDRPIFTMDQSQVRENESVGLKCSAQSHPTALLIVRNMDNKTIVVQQETDELIHTIRRAQCLHNGTFVCSGENKDIGVLYSQMISLNVLCSPRHDTRKPLKRNVSSGLDEIASLLLDVISNPAPSFRWYLSDNQQLIPIPNITKHEVISTAKFSVLQIHVINVRDYASYVVEATSNHDTLRMTFNLLPKSLKAQEVPSDRFGMGFGIGIASVVPLCVIGFILIIVYFKRRDSHMKKGAKANMETAIDIRPANTNDNRGTYSDLTPTPGNEYEELKVQRSEGDLTFQHIRLEMS